MLLEPQCTGSIASSSSSLEINFLVYSKTKPDQAFSSHVHGKSLAPQHLILVMVLFYYYIFWETLYITHGWCRL